MEFKECLKSLRFEYLHIALYYLVSYECEINFLDDVATFNDSLKIRL